MNRYLQKFTTFCVRLLPAIALFCAEHAASGTSSIWMYQPDVPEALLEREE